jgi:hypothetical protein
MSCVFKSIACASTPHTIAGVTSKFALVLWPNPSHRTS